MSRRKKTPTRREGRRDRSLRSQDVLTVLIGTAGHSLGMTPEQCAQAHDVYTGANPKPDPVEMQVTARILARCCDMLESRGYGYLGDASVAELRAQISDACGAEFLDEVRSTGESASTAAQRIAAVLVAVLIYVLASPLTEAVRIRYRGVNLARLWRLLHDATQWRGTNGDWRRRFGCGTRRRSNYGRRCGRGSSSRRANERRSLSGSISRRTTPTNSPARVSLSSRSDEPTARLNARLTLRHHRLCASSRAAADKTTGGAR